MKTVTFIACSLITVTGFSQMDSFDADPSELVYDILQGQSISVSNVQFQGHTRQIGYFYGNVENIPFQTGIIMSSGLVNGYGPWGPNDTTRADYDFGRPGDSDLQATFPLSTLNDAAVLEFDFVPSSDWLKMKLLFASEEYGFGTFSTNFNDGIGIYLIDPNNIKTNIALVQNQNISVNTINPNVNSTFYITNGNGSQAPYNSSNTYCRYDGLTRPIDISASVTPNQTHHLKIAIGDSGDGSFDSALFLEAFSMMAVGLKDDLESNLQLSPNPVNDFLTVESSTENLTIHILDLNGKNLLSKDLSGLSEALDLSSLQSGTYLVKLCSSTNTLTKKILKL
jgi:hypothetical protein